MGALEGIPGDSGQEAGFTLDRVPICPRGHIMDNLRVPISPLCIVEETQSTQKKNTTSTVEVRGHGADHYATVPPNLPMFFRKYLFIQESKT